MSDPNDAQDQQPNTSGDPDAALDRTYVNHCAVRLSLSTAELDFGQASETDQSVRVKSRLVTSPSYFRQLGDLIRDECQRYDRNHGLKARNGEG